MDLSFLTGNAQPQPAAYQPFNNSMGANNPLSFGNPTSSYVPGAGIGMPNGIAGNPLTQQQGGYGGLTDQLGLNVPTFQLGLGTLNSLGSLYGAFSGNNLAKQQLQFAKETTNTNLNNQIKSYNTALEDRARSRGAVEGQNQTTVDDYINKNRLTR